MRNRVKRLWKKWWIKWLVLLGSTGLILFFGLFASVYFGFWGKVATKEEIKQISQLEASQVFASDSSLIGKYFITNRTTIKFEEIPQSLIHALVATEDERFFEHDGIDEKSLFRVFFKTILMGDESSGGGSTITMQLAKNLYGREDYGVLSSVINKLKEAIIAMRIEAVFSKNEIITLYLNTVPFSGNTYGVESAAQKIFNTSTNNLTILQSSTLVGTLKANHSYNPRLFPENSKNRRNVVLQQMVKNNYLKEEKAKKLQQKEIKVYFKNNVSNNGIAAYFTQQVREKVEKILASKNHYKPDGTPYDILRDGLKIYTTLNLKMQRYAMQSMRNHMHKLQKTIEESYGKQAPWKQNSSLVENELKSLNYYQVLKDNGLSHREIITQLSRPKKMEVFSWGKDKLKEFSTIDSLSHYLKMLNVGFVAVHPNTGAVNVYIGGIDYDYFPYDHVSKSKRSVGSTFKPFVFTAALEKGLQPCDYFSVREVVYTDEENWLPQNAEEKMDPEMNYSLTAALTNSLNTVSVKVLQKTGIQRVIEQVHRMGIEQKIEKHPSIALGVSSIRVIEMAEAYTSYLNEGHPSEPYFIERIEDKHGNTIYKHTPEEQQPSAFSEETRQIMLEMLQRVVDKGTASRLRTLYGFNNEIAGKTGTTQNNTDGWFIGLLPNLVTVTWVGNDNPAIKFRTTRVGQGANSALPIFAGFLNRMNKDEYFKKNRTISFPSTSRKILEKMECPPTKRNGLFKRIFTRDKVKREFKKEK